jgi:hypothetical protein
MRSFMKNTSYEARHYGGFSNLLSFHPSSVQIFPSAPYYLISRMMKSRRMRWAGHVARIGEKRNAYRILVGKPEGKRPSGRGTCR